MVEDDGIGGADARNGSGLAGLKDRVEALGATLKSEASRDTAPACTPTSRLAGAIELPTDVR